VLARMKLFGRVPLCGMISQYNDVDSTEPPGIWTMMLMRRLTVRGFIVTDFMPRFGEAAMEMAGWMMTGKLKTRQDIRVGLEHAAETEVGTSLPIDCELAMGTPVREILSRATTLPCDMLVMGTHGRSGFEHLVLGSVTEKVLRKAECPVLSVPRRVEPVDAPAGQRYPGPARREHVCETQPQPRRGAGDQRDAAGQIVRDIG